MKHEARKCTSAMWICNLSEKCTNETKKLINKWKQKEKLCKEKHSRNIKINWALYFYFCKKWEIIY